MPGAAHHIVAVIVGEDVDDVKTLRAFDGGESRSVIPSPSWRGKSKDKHSSGGKHEGEREAIHSHFFVQREYREGW
jgi:hypothetical protein